MKDARAQVFLADLALIITLAHRGCLLWYLIENVVGVLRALGKMIPFVVQVYTTLHKHLPFSDMVMTC